MGYKKTCISILITSILCVGTLSAQGNPENNFFIIPQTTNDTEIINGVKYVGEKAGQVTNRYNEIAAQTDRDLAEQLSSGIMTWDTLLDYVVYLIRFVSQVGILIGAIWIIIAGYKYAVSVFNGGNAEGANDNIKSAIVGVIIIAASYGIMKILTNAFL